MDVVTVNHQVTKANKKYTLKKQCFLRAQFSLWSCTLDLCDACMSLYFFLLISLYEPVISICSLLFLSPVTPSFVSTVCVVFVLAPFTNISFSPVALPHVPKSHPFCSVIGPFCSVIGPFPPSAPLLPPVPLLPCLYCLSR